MRRPRGQKYRNLHAFRNSIWYERVVEKRRYRENTEEPALPRDRPGWLEAWSRAARFRDVYELERGIGQPKAHVGQMPTFAAMARRYLNEDMSHLASTTKVDHRSHLRPGGPVLHHLGEKLCDEISGATLRLWWNREIADTDRSDRTGFKYLSSIAVVFSYAVELDFLRENPVDVLHRQLARRRRSKQGRAASADVSKNPIRDPEQLSRLVEAAREEGLEIQALVLVLLDAGVRLGECLALRWRCVAWGADDHDPRRHLHVEASRSRGGEAELPKSGRSRRVQLSMRAREALGDLYLERFRESPHEHDTEGLVFGTVDGKWFRRVPWARICRRAGLTGYRPKDLRDTYASWLLTAGLPVAYIAKQLGHGSTAVTEASYADWISKDAFYLEPVRLEPGEVPADLLARLPESPQLPTDTDVYDLPVELQDRAKTQETTSGDIPRSAQGSLRYSETSRPTSRGG